MALGAEGVRRTIAEEERMLDTMLKLFGPEGEHWGKEEYLYDADGRSLLQIPDVEQVGSMCLLGAMAMAHRTTYGGLSKNIDHLVAEAKSAHYPVYCALADATNSGEGIVDIASYNDAPERTFEEIKQVIEAARVRLPEYCRE